MPGRAPAPVPRADLVVEPFRAAYLDPQRVDLGAVVCPPYDVVEQADDRSLRGRSPYNAVHVVRPRIDGADGHGGSPYDQAAARLDSWRRDGVLRRDVGAAFYVYEQVDTHHRQRGVLAAVQVGSDRDRAVLPHENVFPGPVTDRLSLMSATGAQLEPILLAVSGMAGLDGLLARVTGGPPWLEAHPPDGSSHRVWRCPEPADVLAIKAAMRSAQALIADGHHRYAAYQQLRRGHHDAGRGAGPWDLGLGLLVDAASDGLVLSAIHRTVAGADLARVLEAATGIARVEPLPLADAAAGEGLLRDLARSAAAPELGTAIDAPGRTAPAGDVQLAAVPVCLTDGAAAVRVWMTPRAADRRAQLTATVTAEQLLPALFGVSDDDPRVRYHHDAQAAISDADRRHGVAILLPAPRLDDVVTLAGTGERMPRKSTSFGPKPRSGLILRILD